MKIRTNISTLVFTLCLLALPSQAQQPPISAPNNDFILRASAAEIGDVLTRHGLTEIDRLDSSPPGEEVCLVRADAAISPEQLIADVLAQEPSVNAIEEVLLASLPETGNSVTLNQAVSEILGALGDTSTVLFDKDSTGADRYVWTGYVEQDADHLVQATQARTVEKGDGAVVAILDTGIDPNHALFDGHLVPGYDFLLDQAGDASEWGVLDESSIAILGESSIAILGGEDAVVINESSIAILGQDQIDALDPEDIPDAFGHGTMVAGIVHLVAPEAKIMPLRVFDGEGYATVFDVVSAIYYAVDQGATVIHMSFSIEVLTPELVKAVDYADQNGVIIVASVGNEGLEKMVYPAGLCNVFGVAATDDGDYVSSFSNLGNDLVSIAAPGENVITAYPGGGWAGGSGTSYAAPWISGAVALLADAQGSGTPGSIGFSQVNQALSWADAASGPGAGKIGHGRADLKSALDNLSAAPTTGPSGCSGSSNLPPHVTITAPAGSSTVAEGDNVSFTATATDTEDGDLTAGLAWTSSLDGPIGSGGSFSTTTLSPGIHTLVATVTDSVLLTHSATISLTVRASVRDTFNANSYEGNQGTQSWTSAWQEIGEIDGPGSGYARVSASSKCASGNCLRLGANLDDEGTVSDRGVERAINLAGSSSATLTFDYRRDGGSSGSVTARAEISGDGGASWTTLANYALDSDDASQKSAVFALENTVALSAETRIRFVVSGAYPEESSRYFYVDNIEITYTLGSSATVRDEFNGGDYEGNDGSQNWTSAWQEIGESNGSSLNYAKVVSFFRCPAGSCLRLGTNLNGQPGETVGDRGVVRSVNLSGAVSATLTFDYRRTGTSGGSVIARVEASGDGGASWTTLTSYPLNLNDSSHQSVAFLLQDFVVLSSTTQIRFVVSGDYPAGVKTYFHVDNVEIAFVSTG